MAAAIHKTASKGLFAAYTSPNSKRFQKLPTVTNKENNSILRKQRLPDPYKENAKESVVGGMSCETTTATTEKSAAD